MYAVSTALRNAIDAGNPQRILLDFGGTSVFSNEEIAITDGVNFTEMFTTGDDLTIGCCPSTELSFSLLNDTGMFNDFQFGQFAAYLGARIDSGTPTEMTKTFTEDGATKTYAFAPLGTFVADRPDIVKKKKLAIVANDRMTLFDVPMPDKTALNITYPITLGNLLSAMCTYLSVTLKSSTFTNSTMSVASEPKQFGNATMREVLGWIAEAACAIARFDRNGQLEIRWYSTVNKTFAETSYSEFTPAWFATDAITGTHIRNGNSNATLDLGTDTNVYIIQDNPFLRQDDSNTRSRGVLRDGNPTPEQNINTLLTAAPQYHPYSASLFTDWTLEAGDVVTVTSDSESYTAPIHNLNMTWYGKPKVDISAEGNPKRETQDADARRDYDTENTAYNNSRLIFEAEEQIVLKVSKGNVATQLSVECGNVSVSGGNLTVSGYITSAELETAIASIQELNLSELIANEAGITTLTTTTLKVLGTTSLGSVTVNGTDLESNAVGSVGPASVDSNTGGVSIQWNYLNGNPGTPVTFNIASTVYFQQAVAAAAAAVTVSGSWATNMFTATASNGEGAVGSFTVGDITSTTVNPNDGHYLTGTVPVTLVGGGSTSYTPTVNIDATPAYNAGAASVTQRIATSAGTITLGSSDTGSSVSKTTTVTYDDSETTADVPVTIDASSVYSAGQNSIQMKKTWGSSGTATIARVTSGGTVNNIQITVTATAGITYNSTAHTYTASAQASADSAVRASDSTNSGTEAYNAGWAAAKAKISRSNDYIQGPPSTVDGAAVNLYKASAWCNKGSTVYYASNGQINAPNGRYVPEGGITWGINWTAY